MKTRLHTPSSMQKQEFLQKWIKGFQTYTTINKNMSILERKKAIKLSADVAIASTRVTSTHWSRAVVSAAAKTDHDAAAARTVVESVSGQKVHQEKKTSTIAFSKKILRRSRSRLRMARKKMKKAVRREDQLKLVKRRTRVLKRLVPGGKEMTDEACLIKETLDYIASLRVQVDVMRSFAELAEDKSLRTLCQRSTGRPKSTGTFRKWM